ncbi:hypothetical protein [Duganella sp. LjRoot269]|uniref:hypothetical protein n=1 Tax=Duganella sp. LjRoot269 TaxID=3342305 RepID=UPI003ED0E3BD
MSKKSSTAPGAEGTNPDEQEQAVTVRARVLVSCAYGNCNDVIDIDQALAETLAGQLDTNPAAVEYAESLVKE